MFKRKWNWDACTKESLVGFFQKESEIGFNGPHSTTILLLSLFLLGHVVFLQCKPDDDNVGSTLAVGSFLVIVILEAKAHRPPGLFAISTLQQPIIAATGDKEI